MLRDFLENFDVGGEKGKVAPVIVQDGVLIQLLDGRLSRVEIIR